MKVIHIPEKTAYVANLLSGTVSVIHLDTGNLAKNVPVGEYPVFSLEYPHDREKLLVTLHNYQKKEGGGRLLLVDPRSDTILREIACPGVSSSRSGSVTELVCR